MRLAPRERGFGSVGRPTATDAGVAIALLVSVRVSHSVRRCAAGHATGMTILSGGGR